MHGYMYSCINMYCMSLLFVIFLFSSFFLSLSMDPLFLLFFLSLSPQVVGLNFSSATTPELLLKTFDHYCEYKRTPNRVIMAPAQLGKWLVLFCDGINLPDLDKYGEREGRDKTREGQERREEDCELRVREAEKKVRKEEGGDN